MIIDTVIIASLIVVCFFLAGRARKAQRERDELRSMYGNGFLGEHSSVKEWERQAQASLKASLERRKNGKT